MVIKLTSQPAFPQTGAARVGIVPRFGSGAAETAKTLAAKEVAHLGVAQKIMQGINKLGINNKDIRVGGLSLEDIAGRMQTLIGVYILQGYFAYKDQKHPWETNGRNAVVWLMTAAVTSWSKSESYGVNTTIFNHFMKEKGTPSKRLPFMQKLFDPLRMNVDYLKILEAAGVPVSDKEKEAAMKGEKALWASSWLDSNKVMRIQNHLKGLEEKVKKEGIAALKDDDKKMLEAIPKFFKRVNIANLGSITLITAATVYLIGVVAMQIVNKLFTPLDKDTGMSSIKSKFKDKTGEKPSQPESKPATPQASAYSAPIPPVSNQPSPPVFNPRPMLPVVPPYQLGGVPLLPLTSNFRPILPAVPAYRQGGLN